MAASAKQTAALASMAASAALAITKLAAGLVTGSLGILSEAIHSLIDFGATIITYFAVKWGDEPPDEEHQYGHAKFESVGALVETGLLFLTTAWIVYEALRRLITGEIHIEPKWWALAIIAASVIIDFNRLRALSRVAAATSSEALGNTVTPRPARTMPIAVDMKATSKAGWANRPFARSASSIGASKTCWSPASCSS